MVGREEPGLAGAFRLGLSGKDCHDFPFRGVTSEEGCVKRYESPVSLSLFQVLEGPSESFVEAPSGLLRVHIVFSVRIKSHNLSSSFIIIKASSLAAW